MKDGAATVLGSGNIDELAETDEKLWSAPEAG